MPITRRFVTLGAVFLPIVPAWENGSSDLIAAIEKRTGGRLGIAVLDTTNGKRIEHRAHERFAMCSTFKFLLVAAVLARIDKGKERFDSFISYKVSDVVPYSPVTKENIARGGMTLSALCEAAIEHSDNTAANLLLGMVGGPRGWTRFAASLGDTASRLDRNETALNSAIPGDPRDTTTPAAMLDDMKKVLLGNILSDASCKKLEDWMIGNTLGAHRLRAGLPTDWRIGDKTGTGEHGARNDIAIMRPPERAPILACVYFTESDLSDDAREAAIADVGRIIAGAI